ncbi:MAG: GntR family transcriptional regulator [Defluviitaleaceae bacterium]|nr:GntR family transcriptional regulator [Defluviitaleaceae bacterium]
MQMFNVDFKNRKPIYEQIIENFKRLIIAGDLKEESRVPSIRDMAKELGVNPNTVQKAYRELEEQSYFYTIIGQGSFIAAPPKSDTGKEIGALYDSLVGTVRELIFRGESKPRIIERVEMI